MLKKFHPKFFFTHDEIDQIAEAIREIELKSTGKISIYLEWQCPVTDPFSRAIKLFHTLNIHKLPQKNGLFIYLATKQRLFAVIADQNLNEKIGPDLWAALQPLLEIRFRNNHFLSAILLILEQIGKKMVEGFPAKTI
ncbi:MAG: hypothetical protein A3G33_00915 [Omnitrophica bacterium RIFCSPLOWO2_12_FULL_44_17]|uniref:TPM domain-containing protein n=1 Tax=Candidatus Danuiimicrobium aquiferis TaxID=1801832 RepID=A0A1G1L2R8_9BACT|nr:MAG: hypothetical protein A3B72_06395 [Omnitrophica bacterium RIFCSPHIGHO2_02_FULL_45_28]OGW89806.1 MAG: hypothetical protein A3E74_10140 [Omnitrophica bacterium RIFCSPHIGHO2_12_FULL_44_12]OGW99440.1 MAG: hypothetical protein A3G33_00915 [Omnitrophica bacterium RIFCSPLOWO2_12_FULL_44_17]OGX03051.1 MAG: hypothetical protein A3J12_04900 [Omnitrophica bacterium RIFCSPLOWO2_02_FULL_44_11]